MPNYGNNGRGTVEEMKNDQQQIATNPQYVDDAIIRTKQVMKDRIDKGMDVNVQRQYLDKLYQARQQYQGSKQRIPQGRSQMQDFLRNRGDAYVDQQRAWLEEARERQIAELKNAYEDAIAEGKISVREAEEQFRQKQDAIRKQAYLDSEATKAQAHNMGIQYSPARSGYSKADEIREKNRLNQAMTTRDVRINNIRDRINALSKQKDLGISRINAEYDAGLLGAQSQADMMYNQGMFDVMKSDYNAERQYNYNKKLAELKQQFNIEAMKTEHGFSMEEMDKQLANQLQLEGVRSSNTMREISARAQQELKLIKQKEQAELDRLTKAYTDSDSQEYKIRMAQIKEKYNNMSAEYLAQAVAKATAQERFGYLTGENMPNEAEITQQARENVLSPWQRVVQGFGDMTNLWMDSPEHPAVTAEKEKLLEAIRRKQEDGIKNYDVFNDIWGINE